MRQAIICHRFFRKESHMLGLRELIDAANKKPLPDVPENIKHGDMPGDKICITPEHIAKAGLVMRALPELITKNDRLVISVCGGSGVGKSEIASVLAFYLESAGVGCYVLSGDNYPRRIPKYNDAERLRIFRVSGIKALADAGLISPDANDNLKALWENNIDADTSLRERYPWFSAYLEGGLEGLKEYLGTPAEIDFDDINRVVESFRAGSSDILLKRMGRENFELWYDRVDLTDVRVLIIEWTHGNSDFLKGVDLPVFLNSTPEETLAHRRERARDKGPDSPFITRVLEIEQDKLAAQAHKAALIISKQGKIENGTHT